MKQLRVAWQKGIHAAREAGVTSSDGGPWLEDSRAIREDAFALAAAGNEVCGPGTHWLEERDIRDPADLGDDGVGLRLVDGAARRGAAPKPEGNESA